VSWRSVVISNPARLRVKNYALTIQQGDQEVSVPLEDIAAVVIDNNQVTLTASVISKCAEQGIALITVNEKHLPNGLLLPFTPHSRAYRMMAKQLAATQPMKKRLWQLITKRKIENQAAVLLNSGNERMSTRLISIAEKVKSGDKDNLESVAAHIYFPTLLGQSFTRHKEDMVNAMLDYGYSIIRSAIAKSLVSYGFLPAFGIHHHSEQNAFNLADDIIEPYRPIVDEKVIDIISSVDIPERLEPNIKIQLINLLHEDALMFDGPVFRGKYIMLSAVDCTIISLQQAFGSKEACLCLPRISPEKYELPE